MKTDTPQARQNLVAVVMICVLGGATALAWLTTGKPTPTIYTGADILAILAAEKIDKYWPTKKSKRHMIGLAGKPAKPVGWEITSIQATKPGEFSCLQIGGPKAMSHKVWWSLSSDLSKGRYVATVYGKNGRVFSQTETTITKDRIGIVRQIQQVKLRGTATRPKNYVPEGALPLVLGIVAETRNAITVKMVFDDIAIKGGKINFVDVQLSPLQSGGVRVRPIGKKVPDPIDYYIDSENRESSREHLGTSLFYRLCDEETISKHFGIAGGVPSLEAKP